MAIAGKRLSAVIAAGLIAAAPAIASAADLSGAWSVYGSIELPGGGLFSASPTCQFQQARHKLSGDCKGPNAAGPLTGEVHGRRVAWQWTANAFSGGSGVVSFAGRLGHDGVIRGSINFSHLPKRSGTFTQQRALST